MINLKAQLWALVVSYFCFYSYSVLAQQQAPDDPDQTIIGEQYLTPNLVEDPLAWSGPQSQGDCTYRPSGHGTYANNPAHVQGDWYTNPAYRSCPQISSDGTMRFSWRPEEDMVLTNNIDNSNPIIAPYAEALAEAGIMVNGYNYSWTIKSADAESKLNTLAEGPYDKEGYGYSQDLLSITVEFIGQENQDVVWSKEYDYNYRIDNWTKFSGSEAFELNGTDFEKIRITVDGYDAGYWSGYFGPEVRNVQFQLIFTVVETDRCDEDPLSSPTCYGYQDAFNESIGLPTQAELLAELESDYGGSNVDTTGQQKIEDFFDGGTPDGTSFEYDEEIEMGIEAEIEVFEEEQKQLFEKEQLELQSGVSVDDGQSDGQNDGQTTGAEPEQIIIQEEIIVEEEKEEVVIEEEPIAIQEEIVVQEEIAVEEEKETVAQEESIEAATAASTRLPTTVNGLAVAQNAETSGNAVATSAVTLSTEVATASLNSDLAISTSLNEQSQEQSISNTGATTGGGSAQSNGGSTLSLTSSDDGSTQSSTNITDSGSTGSMSTSIGDGSMTSASGYNMNVVTTQSFTNDGGSGSGNIDNGSTDFSTNNIDNTVASIDNISNNSSFTVSTGSEAINSGSDTYSANESQGSSSNLFGSGSVDYSGGSGDIADPSTGIPTAIANNDTSNNSGQSNSNLDFGASGFDVDQSAFIVEVKVASLDQNIIDDAIKAVFDTIIQNQLQAEDVFSEEETSDGELTAEEEEALVVAAQSGDDSEDAQAALLGYNPNFRAYQAPQLPDSQFYQPKEIYGDQENYDNPNQRFFNGASDATHREMVRQQYKR